MPITIRVKNNGPYVIEAEMSEINLVDHDMKPITIPPEKKRISLCRCGASVTKPFCDGTHSKIGFKGAEEAQKEFDATT
jgi:CDGSH-type Zn-finger protein